MGQVSQFLRSEIVAGLTGMHLAGIAGIVILLIVVVRFLKPKPKVGGNHLIKKRCQGCGWAGEVSSFNKKCPKCANAIT